MALATAHRERLLKALDDHYGHGLGQKRRTCARAPPFRRIASRSASRLGDRGGPTFSRTPHLSVPGRVGA